MDPVTLATLTASASILASEVAKGFLGEAGKDVWKQVKGVLGFHTEPTPAELAPRIAKRLLEQPSLADRIAPLLQSREAGSAAAMVQSIHIGQGTVTVVGSNTGTISTTNTFGNP